MNGEKGNSKRIKKMPYVKTIACLANSTKHYPGRCFAGIDIEDWRTWIRPVSNDVASEGAIYSQMSALGPGLQPQVLDILEIEFSQPVPDGCQTENHLISGRQWVKRGQIAWVDIVNIVERHPGLWPDYASSTRGLNDRVSVAASANLTNSLRLIQVDNNQVTIRVRHEYEQRKIVRADFRFHGVQYRLRVTDPIVVGTYLARDVGDYDINAALCISLGEVLDGWRYKLVAAIFQAP